MTPRRSLVRALLHPIRATIEKHLRAAGRPVPLRELADALGLELVVARHHVRALAACGYVAVDGDGWVSSPS